MENIFIDIMELTIPVSIWIALLLMCSPLLKRSYAARWRYYMWLFVAVRLIIPIRFKAAAPITMELPESVGKIAIQSNASGGSVSVTLILTVIWLVGMTVYAGWQAAGYISFSRLVKRWSRKVKDEAVLNAFDEAKREMGVKREIEIKTCSAVTTPMIFGIVKPMLLMPKMELNKEDFKPILCHELVHFKRNDIIYKLLVMCAVMIHWFNPLVHIMLKAANRDIELACDAEIVKSMDGELRQRYCETILRIVHNGRTRACALSTCFIFSKKTVLERFKNILDEKIKRSGVIMFCVVAVSVAVSGGAVGFATERIAEELEENLQIIERPAEPQKSSEEIPEPSEVPESDTAYVPESSVTEPKTVETAPRVKTEQSTPEGDQIKWVQPVNDVSIGADKQEIHDAIGEPDTVSGNGFKETYEREDGSTVVLQYDDNGTLDTGYIVVGE
ncbi:MAG: hypothetical protein J1G06_06890 [Oscillospiraceae bacterium]|nr:hypothetical protein [Oscillospiraceae bacterium]